MKQLSKLMLVGGLTTFLLVMIVGMGVWNIAQSTNPSAPVAESASNTVDNSAQLTALEQNASDRAALYQEQFAQLQDTMTEREQAYQTEIQKATEQLTAYQTTISQQKENSAVLGAQIPVLKQTLLDRQLTYQTQLSQTQASLVERQTQLTMQIQEAQVALATANAQLGR